MADKKRVLILCAGNSGRSQMAEGPLRHDAGDRFSVESAGTKPSTVRPDAIEVFDLRRANSSMSHNINGKRVTWNEVTGKDGSRATWLN